MTTTLFTNYTTKGVGTSAYTVITTDSTAGSTTTITGMTCANTTNLPVTVDVFITRSAVNYYIVKGATVPASGSLTVAGWDQKIVLIAGDTVKVQSSAAASIDVVASALVVDGGAGTGGGVVPAPPSVTIISSYVAGTSASSAQTRAGISQSIFFSGSQTTTLPVVTNAAFAAYPMTIEAFVWATANGNVIQLRNATSNQSTVLYNNYWAQTERTGNYTTGNSVPTSTGSWQHIGFTLFSSIGSTTVADRLLVFANGSNVSSTPISLPIVGADNYQATGETVLQLGMWQFNVGSYGAAFTGYVSDIRVSSGARYGTTAGTYTVPSGALTLDGTALAVIRAA